MNYEISKGTLAIVPNQKKGSLVYEDEYRYLVSQTPYNIMEESCKYFGSSYEGRKAGAREILGAEYKVPIVVEDSDNLILFPTTSPLAPDCSWISLKRIKKYYSVDQEHTKIVFDNGKEIVINSSYRTIENQISRASRLDFILRSHKNS